jgi:deoxyribodipyrimidine photo-lyase
MREFRATGTMHNRVRMVAASFLIKYLMTDWRRGADWFWDTLLDADLANNAASWQWVAGSGADAAPSFRILNPVLQGEKFDPDRAYEHRWIPELAPSDPHFIHRPWEAPNVKALAYPSPIVEHAQARARALAEFKSITAE